MAAVGGSSPVMAADRSADADFDENRAAKHMRQLPAVLGARPRRIRLFKVASFRRHRLKLGMQINNQFARR